jgi:hypothetical protein
MERRESAARVRQSGSPGASDQSRMGCIVRAEWQEVKGYNLVHWLLVGDHRQEDNELEDEETSYGPLF